MSMVLFYSPRYGSGTTTAATAYAVTAMRDRPVFYIETGQFPDGGLAFGGRSGFEQWVTTQPEIGLSYIHAPDATPGQVDELVQRFEFVQRAAVEPLIVVDTHHLTERDLQPDAAWGVVMARFQDLHSATRDPNIPKSLIVTAAAGWPLTTDDVADVLGRRIDASVAYDPAVQRNRDAGIISSRLPRALQTAVDGLELPPLARSENEPPLTTSDRGPVAPPGGYANYGWVVTEDHTELINGEPTRDVALVSGPWNISPDIEARHRRGQGSTFHMFDDDGEHYYTGRFFTTDIEGGDIEAPLTDFGMPNAGCTRITYLDRRAAQALPPTGLSPHHITHHPGPEGPGIA